MRRRDNRGFSFEHLENRVMLAGNVTVSVTNGTVRIVGDDLANEVSITRTGDGSFLVEGLGTTTVNGGTDFEATGVTRDMIIDLRGENDTLQLGDGTDPIDVRTLEVRLGDGDDEATLTGIRASAGVNINAGDGGDTIALVDIQANNLTANLGAGDDSLDMTDFAIARVLTLRGGAGDDSIGLNVDTLTASTASNLRVDLGLPGEGGPSGSGDSTNDFAMVGVTISGSAQIRGAGGVDNVVVDSSTLNGELRIRTGQGDDFVAIRDSQLGSNLRIETYAGNDDVVLDTVNVDGGARIATYAGDDLIAVLDSLFGTDLIIGADGGNDTIVIEGVDADDEIIVRAGTGDDNVEVLTSTAGRSSTFEGGPGNDNLNMPVNPSSRIGVRGFETDDDVDSPFADLDDELEDILASIFS